MARPIDGRFLALGAVAAVAAAGLVRRQGSRQYDIPRIEKRAVYHVGSKRKTSEKPWGSHEGRGLSVSEVPGVWSRIADLVGPTYKLTRKDGRPGLFVDYWNLSQETRDRILADGGLVFRGTAYQTAWETEDGGEYVLLHATRAEAERQRDVVEPIETWFPTEQLKRLWAEDFSSELSLGLVENVAFSQTIALWGAFDGIWWEDVLIEEDYSAPRGVIFPSKVPEWKWRWLRGEESGYEDEYV